MKIFISSVRRGLESERDALPALVKALGHEPVRFEDFSAQSAPSREACIKGVESSDVYLLMLGPQYGFVFPETGQSATHDEWMAAQRIGIPRYVFRKTGVEFDTEQKEFERTLGDYGAGRFYKEFADVAELQQAVVAAVRELETVPDPLDFEPLDGPVAVRWLSENPASNQFSSSDRCLLEVHVVPIDGKPLPNRVLEQIRDGLPVLVRNSGLVSAVQALQPDHVQDGAVVRSAAPGRTGGWQSVHDGSFASVMALKDGSTTVTFRLPGDEMGGILNAEDSSARIASALRLAGQSDKSGARRFAVGVGLSSSSMVTVGALGTGPRNNVSMGFGSGPVHVEPDESMSRTALDVGANEAASLLSRSLIQAFQRTA